MGTPIRVLKQLLVRFSAVIRVIIPSITSFAILITGWGIGWLAGLSVSPVISIVVTSVTGAIATIIAALSGAKDEFLNLEASPTAIKHLLKGVTPVPLTWLVVGLAVGASAGIWVRTHNWLSPNPNEPSPVLSLQEEVTQWETLGLAHDEIVRALFEQRVLSKTIIVQPVDGDPVTAQETPTASYRDTVLFTILQDECVEITERAKSDTAKSFRLYLSSKLKWQKLTKTISDDTVLREVIAALCVNGG